MVHHIKDNKPQKVFLLIISSILTHVLGNQVLPISAAGSTTSSETTSSSQPLWSYQVKPSSYVNAPNNQANPYGTGAAGFGVPSIFDTINGLSQRQGALSGSPFLSILPIILIAAGGMLLLLPLLTMMMASPFGGGFGGGYQNGFGYPQVGALKKKRASFDRDQFNQMGLIDLIEHVSSSIEELTKKYSTTNNPNNAGSTATHKRSFKSMNSPQQQHHQVANEVSPQPSNHRAGGVGTATLGVAESTGSASANVVLNNNQSIS